MTRSREQRRVDTLGRFQEIGGDAWVASSGAAGVHLVPLSYAWHSDCVLIACEASSLTARNVIAAGSARLAIGPTRDVVMVDATVERIESMSEISNDVAELYERQAGWDARVVPDNVLIYLKPDRIQAWREADEMKGRTLMRAGAWLP